MPAGCLLAAAPALQPTERFSGIYIHVPFCLSKCRYCDFYSITQLDLMTDFTVALLQEMAGIDPSFPPADTLYFGGGTPSLLPVGQLAKIIERAALLFSLPARAEITLEMNPATIQAVELKALRQAGVNRVNIGIQSFQEDQLAFLGRIHSAGQAISCVEAARRAGFDNLGIDLIYGLPGQSSDRWRRDLKQGMDLFPEHCSCYLLSYEAETPLYQALQSGAFNSLTDKATARLFRLTHNMLSAVGYEHYEISNFAKTGYRSRHNSKYWTFDPYLGLGPAAHSYQHPARWWNHRSLQRYLAAIRQGQTPLSGREILTSEQHLIEILYLGLRQSDGIDWPMFTKRLPCDARDRFEACLARWKHDGYVEVDQHACRLTVAGMLLLDHIAADLAASLD